MFFSELVRPRFPLFPFRKHIFKRSPRFFLVSALSGVRLSSGVSSKLEGNGFLPLSTPTHQVPPQKYPSPPLPLKSPFFSSGVLRFPSYKDGRPSASFTMTSGSSQGAYFLPLIGYQEYLFEYSDHHSRRVLGLTGRTNLKHFLPWLSPPPFSLAVGIAGNRPLQGRGN